MTPEYEAMRRRNQLALQLMNQNRVDPNQGPWSAVANLGQTLASAFMARRMGDQEDAALAADRDKQRQTLAAIMQNAQRGDMNSALSAAYASSNPEQFAPLVGALMAQSNRQQDRSWSIEDADRDRTWSVQDAMRNREWDVTDQDRAFDNNKTLAFIQADLIDKRDAKRRQQELQDQATARGYQVEDRDFAAGLTLAGKEADRKLENSPQKATGEERTSAGYLGRILTAEKIMGDLEKEGFDPSGVVEKMRSATNVTASPGYQMYRQAQEDWVRAKLRKESGAVIGDEEMDREIKVYFPQFGDSEDVIKQKAASRAQAARQLEITAGRAAPLAYQPATLPSYMKPEDVDLINKYSK